VTLGNDNWTDGQADRQTDRQSATQYAAPPREEGRIKTMKINWSIFAAVSYFFLRHEVFCVGIYSIPAVEICPVGIYPSEPNAAMIAFSGSRDEPQTSCGGGRKVTEHDIEIRRTKCDCKPVRLERKWISLCTRVYAR